MLNSNTTLAIILGVSECPRAPALQSLPQCRNSAEDFEQYLRTTLNLSSFRLINLFDSPLAASEQLGQIEDFLVRQTASESKPTDLIVYYSGHGGFSRNDQAYFLAVQKTRAGTEGATSIRYIDLASTIKREAHALRKYLILDCCFAAAAAVRTQSDISQLVVQRVEDELPPSGTAFLCSSAAKLVSIAPVGERNTMFSGALLQCLKEGIEGASKVLTLEEVGKRAREIIVERFPGDSVRPELHVPEQSLGDPAKVPLFPNPRWVDTSKAEHQTEHDSRVSLDIAKTTSNKNAPSMQEMTTSKIDLPIDSDPEKKTSFSQRLNEFVFRHRSKLLAFLGAIFAVPLFAWAFQSWSSRIPLPIDIFPQAIEVMRFSDAKAEVKATFSTYNKDQNASNKNCQMDLRANQHRVYQSKETYWIGTGVYRGTATFDVLGLDATSFNADYEIRIKCYGQETEWLNVSSGFISFKAPN